MTTKQRIMYLIVAAVIGVAAFVWLIMLVGWKIGLALFLILWSNNVGVSK